MFETELEKVVAEYNATLSWEEGFIMATRFALENRRAVYHVYNSLRREELERYLYNVAGGIMTSYVDRVAEGIPAQPDDKRMIAMFYQSALTEMVIRWIAGGMKDDPEAMIRRIGRLFDGNIELSLRRSAGLAPYKG